MAKRFIVSLCTILIVASGLPTRAYAEEGLSCLSVHAYVGQSDKAIDYIPIMPLWSHTFSIAVSLNINNNGRALMTGSVIGQPGTERISVNARLERLNSNGTTTHIGSWGNIQSTGVIWAWERPHYVARGHYYRLTLTSTVFRHGTSETVSMSRTSRAN